MDKKLDEMSTALMSKFSLMLAQFQSGLNLTSLSGDSAVPGYSGCHTEPPFLQKSRLHQEPHRPSVSGG